ncbi:protein of unknown function [Bradyrhizobium sp. ORS 285]|nr:hypothetical protein BRAO285_100065 [Bradyrhizobium sp. ORS 285]SMX57167.1 protein of unknown function [Bradyrhizobium sp. ORS 285]
MKMCLIIDNNVAHEVVQKSRSAMPIIKALDCRKVMLATGGLHLQELLGNKMGRLIKELIRNGRARNFSGPIIESKTKEYEANESVRSDDPHILALAAVSGARVLYTRDKDLIGDFRNKSLISPRGSIYSSERNEHLLRRCCSC